MQECRKRNFTIGDIKLRIAAVSGLGNTRRLLQQIERGEVHYDFVEVMACPGGCVGGGGQPIHDGEELRLREAESSMRWTQKQNCAIPMKTRISGRSTVISLESRCPIRRICCCIRSIGKIIKVSVKLRIQEKHADAGMKKQLILCRKFKLNVCEG
mgnify:CR=1 FL=1